MKILLQLGFIVVLTSLCTVAYSQNLQFSLQAGGNYSLIQSIEYGNEARVVGIGSSGYTRYFFPVRYTESFDSKLGGSIKGNLDINLGRGFYTRVGLGLSLIRFKKNITYSNRSDLDILGPSVGWNDSTYVGREPIYLTFNNSGNYYLIGQMPTNNEADPRLNQTNLVYLDIPVMIGYGFFKNKLNLRLGGTASVLAYSETFKNDQFTYGITKDTSSDGLSNMMLSGNTEVSYRVWNNFAITASYSRQFNSIYDKFSDAKNQHIGLGVEYRFSPKIAPNTSL